MIIGSRLPASGITSERNQRINVFCGRWPLSAIVACGRQATSSNGMKYHRNPSAALAPHGVGMCAVYENNSPRGARRMHGDPGRCCPGAGTVRQRPSKAAKAATSKWRDGDSWPAWSRKAGRETSRWALAAIKPLYLADYSRSQSSNIASSLIFKRAHQAQQYQIVPESHRGGACARS